MKGQKTNVMRILEQKKIPYTARSYPHGDQPVDGVSVAQALGQDPASVFKTLVAQSGSGHFYVFVIPVAEELDLKKAARAVGEKSISMLPLKSLTALTGYVRGGCSPVGMKKLFPTTFHESALAQSAIAVSAGKIGEQVLVAPQTLADLVRGSFADLIVDKTKE